MITYFDALFCLVYYFERIAYDLIFFVYCFFYATLLYSISAVSVTLVDLFLFADPDGILVMFAMPFLLYCA